MKRILFWDITLHSTLKFRRNMSPLSPGLKNKLSLPSAFTLVSCSAYSSTLKMEAIYFSKMLVDFQYTVQRYIPEDSTLCNIKLFMNCTALPNTYLWLGTDRDLSAPINFYLPSPFTSYTLHNSGCES
jgi:hypothetical protein